MLIYIFVFVVGILFDTLWYNLTRLSKEETPNEWTGKTKVRYYINAIMGVMIIGLPFVIIAGGISFILQLP
jgi:heme/copper-type cytochrome/quinol oxidase subunit 2